MVSSEGLPAPVSDSPRVTPHAAPDKASVDGAQGLTAAEAAQRLSQFGPNQVKTGGRFHVLRMGLGLLANPLVLILLAASVVSGIVGETLDAGIIITIVLLSVALDFFQIFHSEQAASKLQSLVTLTASVWRDGQLTEIPMRDVVPGDVLEVRAGDLLAADAILLSAVTLSVDQAALTGDPARGETCRRRPRGPAVSPAPPLSAAWGRRASPRLERARSSARSPRRWWRRHRRPSTSAARAASA